MRRERARSGGARRTDVSAERDGEDENDPAEDENDPAEDENVEPKKGAALKKGNGDTVLRRFYVKPT